MGFSRRLNVPLRTGSLDYGREGGGTWSSLLTSPLSPLDRTPTVPVRLKTGPYPFGFMWWTRIFLDVGGQGFITYTAKDCFDPFHPLPFRRCVLSFGDESLLTVARCRSDGSHPVLRDGSKEVRGYEHSKKIHDR